MQRRISLLGRRVLIFWVFVSPKSPFTAKIVTEFPGWINIYVCYIFAKAWFFLMWPNKSHDVTIETPANHSLSRQDIVFHSVENNLGITLWFVISTNVSSLQITLKLHRNHDLNDCTPMDNSFIRLCPRPSNPNTVWKLRLLAFCMCYYFLVSYWWFC